MLTQALPHILAVGHGRHSFKPEQKGLICLWSTKNPGTPLWELQTAVGVVAVDWSKRNGNLLAVGFRDGTLAVYDARTPHVRAFKPCTSLVVGQELKAEASAAPAEEPVVHIACWKPASGPHTGAETQKHSPS